MACGKTKTAEADSQILSYENRSKNEVVLVALIVSVVFTNIFVIFSPDDASRFYNAGLTSTVTIGVALAICLMQVYRYKRRGRSALVQVKTKQSPYYYNNNKMHFSICLFLGLWFVAQFVWTFPYQQTAGVWIGDSPKPKDFNAKTFQRNGTTWTSYHIMARKDRIDSELLIHRFL